MTSACGSALSQEQKDQVLSGTSGGGGSGPDASGGGATGDGSSTGGGGSTGGGSTGGGSTGGAPVACTGTGGATDTGVTATSIKIANVSDISGPVAGLFEAAQQATKAYVAYVNGTGGVCGRKLDLMNLDARTDSRGEQEGTTQACQQAFAMVGSMSAYDQGGAQAAASCGIPDIRAASVTVQRQGVANSFGVNSTRTAFQPTAVADYFKGKYPDAVTKAAFVYLNTEVTKQNSESFMKAFTGRGFNFIYSTGIDITDSSYASFVVQMKEKGVQYVQWLGSGQHGAKLVTAMKQQGFAPQAFVMDPTAYDANFVKLAGAAAEGMSVFINTSLLEESGNKEQQLYRTWLARVAPNARPDYFGYFAWGAAKLFVQQVAKAGPNLKRTAIIDGLKGVHDYTADGLFAAQDVGGKRPSKCWTFIRLQGGKWVREAPSSGYKCGDIVGV